MKLRELAASYQHNLYCNEGGGKFPERSVNFYQTTRCHIPGYMNIHATEVRTSFRVRLLTAQFKFTAESEGVASNTNVWRPEWWFACVWCGGTATVQIKLFERFTENGKRVSAWNLPVWMLRVYHQNELACTKPKYFTKSSKTFFLAGLYYTF
jgi:hypothetical protein